MASATNSRRSSLSSTTRTFLPGFLEFGASCMAAPFPEEGRPGGAGASVAPRSPPGVVRCDERLRLLGRSGALLDGLDLDYLSRLRVEGRADLVARLELVDGDRLTVAGDGRLG